MPGVRWRVFGVLSVLVAVGLGGHAFAPRQAAPSSDVIDAADLLKDLRALSSDDMEGRQFGTPGGERARAYIAARMKARGLQPLGADYFSPVVGPDGTRGANVLAIVRGTRPLNESRVMVVSAHYDHVGVRNGQVFNGADDNASGTAALVAIGHYFQRRPPANSIILAAFDGEEAGEVGSRAFMAALPVAREKVGVDVNIDMIAREANNRLFVVGTRQWPQLKPYIERAARSAPVRLIMGHDDPANTREEDWSRDSDHYVFSQARIPALYFGVEDFAQHHQATDDFETITPSFYVHAVETVIAVIRELDVHLEVIATGRALIR